MTRCIWSKNRWEVENRGAEHQAVWKGIPTTYSCPSVGRRIFPWVGPYQVLLYINMSVATEVTTELGWKEIFQGLFFFFSFSCLSLFPFFFFFFLFSSSFLFPLSLYIRPLTSKLFPPCRSRDSGIRTSRHTMLVSGLCACMLITPKE